MKAAANRRGCSPSEPETSGTTAAATSLQTPLSNASYRSALRSTTITGLSQIVVLLLAMVRSKAVAVLLGPAGIGLLGLLVTIRTFASTVASLGISGSAIRQVADAAASGDQLRIARVVKALRWSALWLGLLGAAMLALAAKPVAELSFGDAAHSRAVALLGLAVLLGSINEGQVALLRGLRRIRELAILSIWGAAFGTAGLIALVWRWGLAGIAPGLVVVAGLSLCASWWYTRSEQISAVRLAWPELRIELRGLLGLGFAFLTAGVLGAAVQFAQRALLSSELGLGAAGEFQAAASLSVVYVGFILQAMSQDFFPRLTGMARDTPDANRLVNEQIELSLLLAGPGVLFTVALAPWLIALLYSPDFTEAPQLLRWQCLGILLRVASWPLGYVLVARGEARLYLVTEVAAHVVHMFAFWWLVRGQGLEGAAFGLVACYLFYLPLIYVVVRRISSFAWTDRAARIMLLAGSAFAVQMLLLARLPHLPGTAAAAVICVVFGLYAYRELARMTGLSLVTRAIDRMGALLRGGHTR